MKKAAYIFALLGIGISLSLFINACSKSDDVATATLSLAPKVSP